jgi:TolB protein
MSRSLRALLSAATLVAVAVGLASFAQDPAPASDPPPTATEPAPTSDVTLTLEGGQERLLRLALPAATRPEPLVGAALDAGNEVERTLFSDLEATEVFDLQGPDELAVAALGADPGQSLETVRSLGNEFLLTLRLLREADRLVLEATLYDLAAGKSILGKRYRAGFDRARDVAHTLADEVLSYLTGRAGIARTQIAFASDRDQTGRKEVYLMDYDGQNQRRLTAHRSTSMSPTWSHDGATVAYTSLLAGTPAIYLADVATGRKTPAFNQGRFNATPTFSPDGARLALARSLDGNIEIFAGDRSGANLQRLTHSPAIDTNPAWSPKGNEIAFTSSRSGSPQIYLMDPEGTNVRRLSYDGDYNDNAAWSPDGTRIAFTSRRNGRFHIAVANVITLEAKVLTQGEGSHEDPTFSPDGRFLAFARKVKGKTQIWRLNAETGSGLRQLTEGANNDSPAWSPYPR